MLDISVVGVPVGIVVAVLVEAIKRLAKIDGDWAIAVSVAVGIFVLGGAYLATISPTFDQVWRVLMGGMLLGFSACGLFDAGQAVKARIAPPKIE